MGKVISTVNMKGGVGKTTLSVNLATCLAKYHGKRVLVLDLDAQISATLSLMSPHEFAQIRRKRRTISYLINNLIKPNAFAKLTIHDLIIPSVCKVDGLELLPGDIELYDEYLVSEKLHHETISQEQHCFDKVWANFERLLIQDLLDPIRDDYDYIIMDCAPGYNLLTRSGIAASDYYLLPARPEPLSIVGIQLLERRIAKLRKTHQDNDPLDLELLGVIFILSGGTFLSRYYNQVMRRIHEDFRPDQLFNNSIPMDVNVAKAVDDFMPVVLSVPSSAGSKAFVKFTQEFLDKVKTK